MTIQIISDTAESFHQKPCQNDQDVYTRSQISVSCPRTRKKPIPPRFQYDIKEIHILIISINVNDIGLLYAYFYREIPYNIYNFYLFIIFTV